MVNIICGIIKVLVSILGFYFNIMFVIHGTRGFITRRINGKINKVELMKSGNCVAMCLPIVFFINLIDARFQFRKSIFNLCSILFVLIIFIVSLTIYISLSCPQKFMRLNHIKGKLSKILTIIYSIFAFISLYVSTYIISIISPSFHNSAGAGLSNDTALKIMSIYLLSFPIQAIILYYLLFLYKKSPLVLKASKKTRTILTVIYCIYMIGVSIFFILFALDLNSIITFEKLFHY